jgi:hypothetical protein
VAHARTTQPILVPRYKFSSVFDIEEEIVELTKGKDSVREKMDDFAKAKISRLTAATEVRFGTASMLSQISNVNLITNQGLVTPLTSAIQEISGVVVDHYMAFVGDASTLANYFSERNPIITGAVREAKLWKQPIPQLQSLKIIDYLEEGDNSGKPLFTSGIDAFYSATAKSVIQEYTDQFLGVLKDEANRILAHTEMYESKMDSHIRDLDDEIKFFSSQYQIDEEFVR